MLKTTKDQTKDGKRSVLLITIEIHEIHRQPGKPNVGLYSNSKNTQLSATVG